MTKIIIAAIAASTILTSAAYANDGKYYLKANAGYGLARQHANIEMQGKAYAYKKRGEGTIGSIALGATLNPNLRTDIEFLIDDGFESKSTFDLNGEKHALKQKTQSKAALINLHYDFKNSSKLTPFVTLGAGYSVNENSMVHTADNTAIAGVSKRTKGFAYQAGFGFAYNLGRADLELGYRYINKGAKKSALFNDGSYKIYSHKASGRAQVIMAGLRVSF